MTRLSHVTYQCTSHKRHSWFCNTLQHAATRCNTLQHTATRCHGIHLWRRAQFQNQLSSFFLIRDITCECLSNMWPGIHICLDPFHMYVMSLYFIILFFIIVSNTPISIYRALHSLYSIIHSTHCNTLQHTATHCNTLHSLYSIIHSNTPISTMYSNTPIIINRALNFLYSIIVSNALKNIHRALYSVYSIIYFHAPVWMRASVHTLK